MILFLLAFLILYGGLNAYLYWTISSGLGQHSLSLAGALAALVIAPLLVRALQGSRSSRLITLLAFLGFNWMGISFIFASVSIVIDLIQWLAPAWSNAEALPWLLGIGSVISLYGFFEARQVGMCRLQVHSPKLPKGKPIRIVQISDLHLGHGTSMGQVRRVIQLINAQKPDLVVSTGDLFDSDLDNLAPHARLLKELDPPLGKIAVTGNHEVYEDLDKALALTEQAGFTVLRDAMVEPCPELCVAGVDDPEALRDRSMEEAEQIALSQKTQDAFTLLLKHRPEINASTIDDFELQLSGHTHGGQIFPFLYLTRLQYRHPHGLSKVAERTYLFLSRGTGSWGPKIRVLARPAITVIDLKHGPELSIVEGGTQPNGPRRELQVDSAPTTMPATFPEMSQPAPDRRSPASSKRSRRAGRDHHEKTGKEARPVAPTKAETALLPAFPGLSPDQIHVPKTRAECQEAADEILAAGVAGFDTEAKPTFRVGEKSHGPHVVQFALTDRAFIFQLHRSECEKAAADLITSKSVLKVGFGLKNDHGQIRSRLGITLNHVLDLDPVFRKMGYRGQIGVRGAMGALLELCFKKSKSTTTSNWALRELSHRQLLYAANDAFAALKIMEALQREGHLEQ